MPLNARLILIPLLLAGAAGCTRIQNNQGYIADEELVASVQPGVDNRQSVERALGRPTMSGQFDDNVWYYISRNTSQLAFARPVPTSQLVLIVRFDPDGTVAAVERRGLELVADISPHGDETPTLGRETGLIEDLFGNIGQVGSVPGGGGGPPQ
ncbi:MAG: outer membrane protein assembly factor BamE [Sandarakinorhabdus sp.]|nr:outer membrane protein assembly factor BamE [Sandarakinorhabdus sp.]